MDIIRMEIKDKVSNSKLRLFSNYLDEGLDRIDRKQAKAVRAFMKQVKGGKSD